MNNCPYANESATCDLPPAEADQGGKQAPTITYCEQCSQVVFRCTSGHWNRAFARYCTQCGQKLEKPAQWDMASANAQRTATLPQTDSVDLLDRNYGFHSWAANVPEIEIDYALPGLIAIDGLVIVPNPRDKKLDAYTIAKPSNQKNLSLKWSISLNDLLTYGTTPIYHELQLFYLVSGGILRQSIFGGEAKPVELNNVDAAAIEPIPTCTPLKCDVNGKPTIVVGLEQGMLLFDFTNNDGNYIKHKFFSENTVMSPTQCGEHIVFTALQGQIFSLNTGIRPYTAQLKGFGGLSFSAPVSLGENVYFEELRDNGDRRLTRFDPSSGQLTKAVDMDNEPEHSLEMRRSFFMHPPLTDGKQVFLSDRYGKVVYTYDIKNGSLPEKRLSKNDSRQMFVPHKSIVVSNRIYSAHSSGLTVLEFGLNQNVQYQSLAMGLPTAPSPVARPIRYGDKLFILCKDRLICRDC